MRMVEKVALLAFLIGVFPLQSVFAQSEPTRVVHTPVTFADAGQPIQIEAYLEGDISPTRVMEAKLWYRPGDKDAYSFEDMYFSGGQYSASIPAQAVVNAGVDYYIEFIFEDGSTYTYPYSNPITEPNHVQVRAAEVGEPEEPVILVSPEPFSEVEGRLLIAVSFNQAVRIIDPKKVRMRINGKDRTREADISEELLVAVIPKMKKKGRQRLDIDYMGDEGMENLGSWSFTWVPEGQGSFRITDYMQANLSSEGRYQKFNGDGQRIFRENFNVRVNAGTFSLTGSGRLTSEEQGTLQPQHRYLVTAGWPSFRVRYGDIKPRYNELILWGRRVRGASLDLNGGSGRVQAIYGELARPLNSHILAITQPDTNNPALYDTTRSPGTYRRWLGAARFSFGAPNRFMIGLMAMKAKDDVNSIEYGQNPKDNLVTGADIEMYLDRRRITLTGQVALSLFNDNIAEAPLDDAEKFKNIIWINQYFDPLPTEGITTDSTTDGGQIKMADVAKSIIGNATSYKGRLRIRYFGNDLQSGYRLINRSYRTMGNPTLINDRRGYFVKDRMRLFKSRLYLEGGYDYSWDNVTGKGDVRNTMKQVWGSISAYTGDNYPDLTFGYRNIFNTNDGQLTVYNPDPNQPALLDSIDTRKENQTGVYNFSVTQQFYLASAKNQMSVSFLTSDRADTYNNLGDAQNNMFSVMVRTWYDQPYMSNFNYSNSQLTSIGGLTDIKYNVFGVRGDMFLLDRKLIPYFGPRITSASGINAVIPMDPKNNFDPANYTDPADYEADVAQARATSIRSLHVNFTKIDWMGGFRWNISNNHQIIGDVSITQYSEKGEYEYWNGNSFSVKDQQVVNDGNSVNQPDVIDRNDVLAMITYQVRF